MVLTRSGRYEKCLGNVDEGAEAIAVTGAPPGIVNMDTVRPLFDNRQIAKRVDQLAGSITSRIVGNFMIVGLLKGSFMFVAGIAGRQVPLIDDIIDTGHTLNHTRKLLLDLGAEQVWTCCLLEKPGRREVDCAADFFGFEIVDVFVVGYGIDYAENYRYLPYSGVVD